MLVAENVLHNQLSPQRSQSSLYSTPEVVDLYQTASSLGKPRDLHSGSSGLSSSFVLVSDESNSGEPPFISDYIEVSEGESKPPRASAEVGVRGATSTVDAACDLQQWPEKSVSDVAEKKGPPLEPRGMTKEVGTQTSADIRDGCAQTLQEVKEEKQPAATSTPTSEILEHSVLQGSPLEFVQSPSEEVVDMSASTVLIERHISQKEGRILKNSNKELRLKIKKLTEVLEQMQKENKRLKNEAESEIKVAAARSALEDKERELRRQMEVMEEQMELELEQYRNHLQQAMEDKQRSDEKLRENAELIVKLQKNIDTLQQQLTRTQEECDTKVKELNSKLQASETKRTVTESENSVLSEKVNRLMKELITLKKSKHHHHHQADEKSKHHVHSSPRKDHHPEDITSKCGEEQKQVKQDHLEVQSGSTSQGGDAAKSEASQAQHVIRACPKPKPRQKFYEAHDPHAGHKAKPKDVKPKPVQAMVAPKLQSVAHLQPVISQQQLPNNTKHGRELLVPYHQQQQTAKPPPQVPPVEDQLHRPSFLPLRGQTKPPPPQAQAQVQAPLPLSNAQKLAATASWVQQLPEPKPPKAEKKVNEKQKEQAEASALTTRWDEAVNQPAGVPQSRQLQGQAAAMTATGNDLSSLSEERIEEITRQLKGESGGNAIVCECPICGKVLHSRESDYGVLLHVELCLQQSASGN